MVLGARRTDRLEALKKEIEAAGGIAAYKETDVVSRDQVVALIKTANDTFGPVRPLVPPFAFVLFICQTLVLFTLLSLSTCLVVGTTCMQVDILVNNAGVMLLSPIDALLQDEWERMLDVNVKVCARSPHCSCRLARDLTHKCACVCSGRPQRCCCRSAGHDREGQGRHCQYLFGCVPAVMHESTTSRDLNCHHVQMLAASSSPPAPFTAPRSGLLRPSLRVSGAR